MRRTQVQTLPKPTKKQPSPGCFFYYLYLMRSVNYELRQAYYSLLAGNITLNGVIVPVYSYQAPTGTTPDIYVVISSISNTGFNNDVTNFTKTTITLTIVTKAQKNNSGADKDAIAEQLLNIIYPTTIKLPVQLATTGELFDTVLGVDTEQGTYTDGQKIIRNRVISFTHQIAHYQKPTTAQIFYGVQDTNADPVNFTDYTSGNPAANISIDYGSQPNPKYFWLWYPKTANPKRYWQDINGPLNEAEIGGPDSLFEVRTLVVSTVPGWLTITQYATGFNGSSAEAKYY